jgi:hypothetical protein
MPPFSVLLFLNKLPVCIFNLLLGNCKQFQVSNNSSDLKKKTDLISSTAAIIKGKIVSSIDWLQGREILSAILDIVKEDVPKKT